ncbi:cytochrome c oxidase assembly protein [Nocardioides sp. TF02-7]|uniref:cytochrome c oxidase assembly protein n=1 Tax=Nocardioides sp. TF02-7 TaxID=2917724 RepID=UPI001F06A54B|nr:cytochrome c oxidase assembly protein [Nocardioides sp. TF02-7]UMG92242.1 bifunctional copper resistance protein CopD/cytochrome c oxidase assembly protein [Nocardioides sp. TF02-7]
MSALGRVRWADSVVLVLVVVVAPVAAVGTLLATGSIGGAPPTGLPDPGALTQWGLPVSRGVRDAATAVTVGALVLATVAVPAKESGLLSRPQRRLARLAAMAAALWLTGVACEFVLTYADAAGQGPFEASPAQLQFFATEMAIGQQLAWNALLAGMTTFAALAARTVTGLALGGALGVVGLWAMALTGHAASDANHDLAVNAQFLHLLGVAVWVGGLVALVWIHRHPDVDLRVIAGRYSRIAGLCYAATAASGLAGGVLRIPAVTDVLSDYGAALGLKSALFVMLGVLGWRQRRLVVRRLSSEFDPPRRWSFLQLTVAELVLMAVATGAGVALARTPPPQAADSAVPVPAEELLGRPMPPRLGLPEWFTQWQIDTLWTPVAIGFAAAYLAGVRRLHRRSETWPRGRTLAWLAGCAGLVWATSGAPGAYGDVLFSMHMVQHTAIIALVPVCFAVAAPITLALRALGRRADGSHGPREWLSHVAYSLPVQLVGHGMVAAPLFVISVVGFYSSSAFEASLRGHTMHLVMTGSALLVGYLFANAVCGIDPTMRRPSTRTRLLLVGATTASLVAFMLGLIGSDDLRAADWFTVLDRPWGASPVEDQQLGGLLGLALLLCHGLALSLLTISGDTRGRRGIPRSCPSPRISRSRCPLGRSTNRESGRVAIRLRRECGGALQGAEAMVAAVMPQVPGAARVRDPHPAYRIDPTPGPDEAEVDVEELGGIDEVAKLDGTHRHHTAASLPCGIGHLCCREGLSTRRLSGDPGGKIDRRAEHVAVALRRRTVVQPSARHRKPLEPGAGGQQTFNESDTRSRGTAWPGGPRRRSS